ncbi:hypothetical protein E2P81_ATG00181 [Venturia nashicola]|uniref:SWIM-type domain-containing protein n=1 Tax=Venturia nashicola TaxID=86259 RepID=A0A4Z1PD28_9PEZI|nr:hypothetical protein E6O75_ATG00188 [Venturia nashicola]TLD39194.1 hypothetical protein E2P81_ATG00181 [Venturia nashicola]
MELRSAMAHTQAGRRVAISARSIEYDPEITYELRTTGSSSVSTANIEKSIDSDQIHFTGLKRKGNKCVEFHGREDFVVDFHNSTHNKGASCTCSNPAPCPHMYWALNQYTNAKCRERGKLRATGVIYPLGKDGRGRRVSIEIEREEIWPLPDVNKTPGHASFVSAYIYHRLGDKTPEDMETSLFSYSRHTETFMDQQGGGLERPILFCSDRPIYAATQSSLEPIIAQACRRDRQFVEECKAILTRVRQTAIKLEDLQCAIAQNFAVLSESWLGMQTDHHERVAKRNLDRYADGIYYVYRVYLAKVDSEESDESTLEATDAASSALIFMLRGAVNRSSLWQELTLTDYCYDYPRDFWTNVFLAFELILQREGLTRQQREEIRAIRERAKALATIGRPTSGIIYKLGCITRA